MEFILGFIYILVVGAVLVSMAALFLRAKRELSTYVFMASQGMVVLWCASQNLILLARAEWQLTAAYLLGNIGICFIGMFWYYFAVLYTGKTLAGLRLLLPAVLAAAMYIVVLTNPFHHLYYDTFGMQGVTHGPLFFVNVALTYLFVILGAGMLYGKVVNRKKNPEQNSPAGLLVVFSVLIPVIFNSIYMAGLVRTAFDITPLGFAISVTLVMLATMKYQFIDFRRELAITNEKLLLEQERNRIAQQVHDTVGHTLTMVQSYMKLIDVSVKNENLDEVGEYVREGRNLTSQGIRELRESINQLRQEASYELVTQGVMQLAGQVKEIPVEVTVQGEDSARYSHLTRTVYDTVRESITNTLKYAEATKLEIVLRFQTDSLELVIGDDGKGCANIRDNNGLRGIRERIEKGGGTVRFLSSDGQGFLTRVKLPVEGISVKKR